MITEKIEDLQALLEDVGFSGLSPDGKYWRTNAFYRDGNNKTALRINRKTGDFVDFVTREKGKLEELIKLARGYDDVKLKSYLQSVDANIDSIVDRDVSPVIRSEKLWDSKELENLFPHYKFYEEKGVSKDTLKFLRSGLSHVGAMSGRYVFPIYNKDGKIHGWSGRDATGVKNAKWKHMGRKANWIYPAFMPEVVRDVGGTPEIRYPVIDAIKDTKEVILVESIGDMLALFENGYKNVLVIFGLSVPNKMISWLMGLGVKRIFIALNNDQESDINRGKIAAIDAFLDVCHYFDFESISICLPVKKDFGMMTATDFEAWGRKKAKYEKHACHVYKEALERLKNKHKLEGLSDDEIMIGKSIKAAYEFCSGQIG